jgi:hypothetical protein
MVLAGLAFLAACGRDGDQPEDAATEPAYEELPGFVDLYWDAKAGRLLFAVDAYDEPLLYQSSLPRGVGSNDLGLDRGQLGATRVVRFERSGPKVLLVQDNLAYRATSEDAAERRAVEESFARSVLWGFEVVRETDAGALVDGTDFFLRDAHDLAARLTEAEEGEFTADASRSAIFMPRTRAFPDNTEIEAIVTFTGQPAGEYLPTVVPDATAISVHMHHSFIRLPGDGYAALGYDPRAGVIGLAYGSPGFADYATPIGEPLYVNYGRRHRLEKQNPEAEVSEAVDPIVYYVDPGAPEPVRTALIEGASWWNEAFEAAGYRDAFQVRMLPAGADPMDVRYNVIQWVHRATRGWSYGSSILDPRTGEIIKGHVTLGSLRVRQDYLIIEGLLAPYGDGEIPDAMLEVALARIRQLSAHEVGHTLGFEHNFAASTQDRASVMDYPFPLVTFGEGGELDFSAAYDAGIGEWDKRAVLYAYQDFPAGTDEHAALREIVEETIRLGFKYVADADARSVSTAHPDGNLWDNGSDSLAELEHLLELRAHALDRFSASNIREGRPLATLEEVLVPVYLLHRFQIEAVGKLLGGAYFDYALRGDGRDKVRPVAEERQRQALRALLGTLDPAVLRLPEGVAEMIPPRPPGNPRSRETFAGHTGVLFDPLAPAASAVTLTLDVLLDPARAARMQRTRTPGFGAVTDALLDATWFAPPAPGSEAALRRQTSDIVLTRLMQLAGNAEADAEVRALALDAVDRVDDRLRSRSPADAAERAHYAHAASRIERWRSDPAALDQQVPVTVPPGSPIGTRGE